eukprot:Nitzschia sp. Nitz4//scaffold5_size260463//181734//182363//NITZ4_001004-RA/size260463-processed-gene-0.336-mRNA-1//1//CDS//3329555406//1100//frame0
MEINVGDIVRAEVRKADVKQEAGLKLEQRSNGNIYVRKVDGLFKRRNVPVQAGDRLHEINGKDVTDYKGGLNEIKALILREMKIWITFERMEEGEEEEQEQEELLMIEGPEELLQLENGDAEESDDDGDGVLLLTDGKAEEEEGAVAPGMEMRLFKLKKKPKLNGTIVEVIKAGKSSGRWEVKLLHHPKRDIAEAGAVISVSEENLREL